MFNQNIPVAVAVKDCEAKSRIERRVAEAAGFTLSEPVSGANVLLVYEIGEEAEKDLARVAKVIESSLVGGVILVSAQCESGLLLRAMQAGVREFLSLPLEEEEFGKALERARSVLHKRASAASNTMGKVVGVVGSKGGVGTTTVAVNLAVELNRRDPGSVVLVDFKQPGGEVSLFLDLDASYTWSEVARNLERLDPTYLMSILTRHDSGLFVLPGPAQLEEEAFFGPDLVEGLLPHLAGMFSTVVVDASASLDEGEVKLFEASRDIVLVTPLSLPSLAGAKRFLDGLSQLEGDLREKVRLVANRYLPDGDIAPAEAESVLGVGEVWRVPNEYQATLAAINQGKPIRDVAPKSAAGKSLKELAKMMAPDSVKAKERKKGGMFASLFARKRAKGAPLPA